MHMNMQHYGCRHRLHQLVELTNPSEEWDNPFIFGMSGWHIGSCLLQMEEVTASVNEMIKEKKEKKLLT